jgi:predicted lipoprotein with Yx(FWY)xxD motif
MRPTRLIALLAAGALSLVACGDDGDEPETRTAESPAADAVVAPGETELGTVLVDRDDRTLYGFTNDTGGRSSCNGACAETWPALTVEEDFTVDPDLDRGLFATVERDDGATQLVAGDWPLYTFSGDAAAGDTNGQGSGGVWFAVGTDGALIGAPGEAGQPAADDPADPAYDRQGSAAPAASAAVRISDSRLGRIVVDSQGRTLYAFTNDGDGTPTCVDACAQAWPAATATGSTPTGEGIDQALISVVTHPEAGPQLKVGTWPLYHFSGDAGPGDVNGQGSGGVWFAVGADGALVRS